MVLIIPAWAHPATTTNPLSSTSIIRDWSSTILSSINLWSWTVQKPLTVSKSDVLGTSPVVVIPSAIFTGSDAKTGTPLTASISEDVTGAPISRR